MKLIVFILVLLFFTLSAARADIYYWTDEKGVLHITDDLQKVPEEYRGSVTVIEQKPVPAKKAPARERPAPSISVPERRPPGVKEELYGGYPLSWWKVSFRKKTQEIEQAELEYLRKRQFVNVFESGRRFGQTYGEKDIDTYERYKDELPELEEKVKRLKDELEELRRKARLAGVPRQVRQQ